MYSRRFARALSLSLSLPLSHTHTQNHSRTHTHAHTHTHTHTAQRVAAGARRGRFVREMARQAGAGQCGGGRERARMIHIHVGRGRVVEGRAGLGRQQPRGRLEERINTATLREEGRFWGRARRNERLTRSAHTDGTVRAACV